MAGRWRNGVGADVSLTSECGPHCGIKDGYEGHCDRCHELMLIEQRYADPAGMSVHLASHLGRPARFEYPTMRRVQ